MTRLTGSPDLYAHKESEPEQSINFMTCHDGFTLNDLVSYQAKHNEDNNEDNRDGNNENHSWNCGIEGPTDDPVVESLRLRQIKNLIALNLMALGAPMILMGDEVRRTQKGNNNAYCQDNEMSWFNWNLVEKKSGLLRFVNLLISARLTRDASRPEYTMTLNQLLERDQIKWHGIRLNAPDWSHQSHCIALTVGNLSGQFSMHYMLNAYHEPLDFGLPEMGKDSYWMRWIDTSLEAPHDISAWKQGETIPGHLYLMMAHSFALLIEGRSPQDN